MGCARWGQTAERAYFGLRRSEEREESHSSRRLPSAITDVEAFFAPESKSSTMWLSLFQGTDVRPDVVRPKDDREKALPKAQVQESDRKEPGGTPQPSGEAVLMDPYLRNML